MTIKKINKDTVKITETREHTIDLKVLRNSLIEIQSQIIALPEPKTKPDNETLDFWNMHNDTTQERENLESEKDNLEKQLKEFEELK